MKRNPPVRIALLPMLLMLAVWACSSQLEPLSISDQVFEHSPTLEGALPWGQQAPLEGIRSWPDDLQFASEYTLESGERTTPQPGATFLWIHFNVQNQGDNAEDTSYVFDIYYHGERTNSTTFGYYGPSDRDLFLWGNIFPGQSQSGWLAFQVPDQMSIADAFLLARPGPALGSFIAWQLPRE